MQRIFAALRPNRARVRQVAPAESPQPVRSVVDPALDVGASRSPRPPQRSAMISAAMLTAVSSGVRAPRSRPIGLDSRASSSSVSPASRSRAIRSSWVRREPIAPT